MSASQREQVRLRLLAHQANLKAIRRDVQPRVMGELESIHADIRDVLDPTQQGKWDTMYEDLVHNWVPPMPEATTKQ